MKRDLFFTTSSSIRLLNNFQQGPWGRDLMIPSVKKHLGSSHWMTFERKYNTLNWMSSYSDWIEGHLVICYCCCRDECWLCLRVLFLHSALLWWYKLGILEMQVVSETPYIHQYRSSCLLILVDLSSSLLNSYDWCDTPPTHPVIWIKTDAVSSSKLIIEY